MSDGNHEKQPATVEEAARLVLEWLSPEDRAQLATMERNDLVSRLHFGLGMAIRNELGLWHGNEKLLEDCLRHDTNELHSLSRAFYTATSSHARSTITPDASSAARNEVGGNVKS